MKQAAVNIVTDILGKTPDSCTRFTTGLRGYVFHVIIEDKDYVLKIYDKDYTEGVKSTVYWILACKNLELAIPEIIDYSTDGEHPYVLLTYIQGNDLGAVFYELTEKQKKDIAKEVIHSQSEIKKLGPNSGYGYLSRYDDENGKAAWKDVVLACVNCSRKRIAENGIFSTKYGEAVLGLLPGYEEYFTQIQAQPFFDDATTKNVLIHEGKFSGIIDLDSLCFGDDLYTIALTRMALLSDEADLSYIDYLKEFRTMNEEEEKILDLYTIIFCINFMSEKGMRFNKAEIAPVSTKEIKKLEKIYEMLRTSISER